MPRTARNHAAPNGELNGFMPTLPWQWPLDLATQWPPVAAEAASALARGFDEIRKVQVRALQEGMKWQAHAAERLRKHPDPVGLLAFQADLNRFQYEQGLSLWMELARAASEAQSELAACGTRLVNTEDVLAGAQFLRTS